MSEFVKRICCEHDWLENEHYSPDGGEPTPAERAAICRTCGATCVRDRGGSIVEYDAFGGRGDGGGQP